MTKILVTLELTDEGVTTECNVTEQGSLPNMTIMNAFMSLVRALQLDEYDRSMMAYGLVNLPDDFCLEEEEVEVCSQRN